MFAIKNKTEITALTCSFNENRKFRLLFEQVEVFLRNLTMFTKWISTKKALSSTKADYFPQRKEKPMVPCLANYLWLSHTDTLTH